MAVTVSPSQTQIFVALVAALGEFGLVAADGVSAVPIIRGQVNRVPAPAAADYVVLWPVTRARLAMNVDGWADTSTTTGGVTTYTGTSAQTQATEITIQADVHGPASADNAARIATLFRDQVGVSAFLDQGTLVAPLYTSEPRQMPFENAEQQTEERWIVDLTMQANVTVTTTQQFAAALTVTLNEVD